MVHKDKIAHAVVSFSICWAILIIFPYFSISTPAFMCLIVGIFKELWDMKNPPHCADWYDLVADLVGIFAYIASALLYMFL